MRHIIDTNCLLSFITDRNPEQNEQVTVVFERASKLEEEVVVISHVISELVYVQLSVYGRQGNAAAGVVEDLLDHPGVVYHHGFFPDSILTLWPEPFGDFGDAVVAAAALTLDLSVYTFDRRFHRALSTAGVSSRAP